MFAENYRLGVKIKCHQVKSLRILLQCHIESKCQMALTCIVTMIVSERDLSKVDRQSESSLLMADDSDMWVDMSEANSCQNSY